MGPAFTLYFDLDESNYGLTLKKLVQNVSQLFSLLLGVLNNVIKIEEDRTMENQIFLHEIQDDSHTQKFTLSPRTLKSVFTILPLGFKARFQLFKVLIQVTTT